MPFTATCHWLERCSSAKAAVLAIVVEALLRIGHRALRNRVLIGVAAAAFVAIYVLDVPFPLIVLGAALIGWVGSRSVPDIFRAGGMVVFLVLSLATAAASPSAGPISEVATATRLPAAAAVACRNVRRSSVLVVTKCSTGLS